METVDELRRRDRALASAGLMCGIVVDERRLDFERGDFLIRGVLGADRTTGQWPSATGAGGRHRPVPGPRRRHGRRGPRHAAPRARTAARPWAGGSGRRAGLHLQRPRARAMFGDPHHDAAIVPTTLGRRRPPPGCSAPARWARSDPATPCTASPPRWPSSATPPDRHFRTPSPADRWVRRLGSPAAARPHAADTPRMEP